MAFAIHFVSLQDPRGRRNVNKEGENEKEKGNIYKRQSGRGRGRGRTKIAISGSSESSLDSIVAAKATCILLTFDLHCARPFRGSKLKRWMFTVCSMYPRFLSTCTLPVHNYKHRCTNRHAAAAEEGEGMKLRGTREVQVSMDRMCCAHRDAQRRTHVSHATIR